MQVLHLIQKSIPQENTKFNICRILSNDQILSDHLSEVWALR